MGFKELKIGGELPIEKSEFTTVYTDSGRSSLRVFLRNYPNKKILVPNFLCETIIDVFKTENTSFEFYNINDNLEIDINSLSNKEFDVLYVINYFGLIHKNISKLNIENKIILEDSVFNFNLGNRYKLKQWFSFNSYRKISDLADGSQIKTNLKINTDKKNIAPFVKIKYKAKYIKQQSVTNNDINDNEYLDLFSEAENIIDNQKDIYNISDISIELLVSLSSNFIDEQNIRNKNYNILLENISNKNLIINLKKSEHSFLVLKTEKRDELRTFLFSKNIYLPVHWPFFGVNNLLYNQIISIPLFSFYSEEQYEYIAQSINEFFITNN